MTQWHDIYFGKIATVTVCNHTGSYNQKSGLQLEGITHPYIHGHLTSISHRDGPAVIRFCVRYSIANNNKSFRY